MTELYDQATDTGWVPGPLPDLRGLPIRIRPTVKWTVRWRHKNRYVETEHSSLLWAIRVAWQAFRSR